MSISTKIESIGIEIGKELFRHLKDADDGSHVATRESHDFVVNAEVYNLRLWCFWESSDHFEYTIEGAGSEVSGMYML